MGMAGNKCEALVSCEEVPCFALHICDDGAMPGFTALTTGYIKSVGCSASKFFGGVAHIENVARFRAMASFAVTRLR